MLFYFPFLFLAGIYSVAGKMTPVGDFRPGKSSFFHLVRLFCSVDGKQNSPRWLPEAELGFIFSSVGQTSRYNAAFFSRFGSFCQMRSNSPQTILKVHAGGLRGNLSLCPHSWSQCLHLCRLKFIPSCHGELQTSPELLGFAAEGRTRL